MAKEKADKLAKEKALKLAKERADKLAKEKAKQLDTSKLSALLDKTPDPKQAAAANEAPTKPTAAKGPVKGDVQGKDSTISANEASFLAGLMRQAVSRCWNINAGLDGIQQMVVKVEVRLSPSGEIVGQPRVTNPQSSPVFRDAAQTCLARADAVPTLRAPARQVCRWLGAHDRDLRSGTDVLVPGGRGNPILDTLTRDQGRGVVPPPFAILR